MVVVVVKQWTDSVVEVILCYRLRICCLTMTWTSRLPTLVSAMSLWWAQNLTRSVAVHHTPHLSSFKVCPYSLPASYTVIFWRVIFTIGSTTTLLKFFNLSFFQSYSVLWCCWLIGRKGICPVKTEWWGTGMVVCLEWGANDLRMVQLLPLPPHQGCKWAGTHRNGVPVGICAAGTPFLLEWTQQNMVGCLPYFVASILLLCIDQSLTI